MQLHKIIPLTVLIVFTNCTQKKSENSDKVQLNIELKDKLENILLTDQGIREIISGNFTDERKSELLAKMNLSEGDIEGEKKFKLMREIDSINIIEVEKIIKKYGYPGKSLVGEPANEAVFYVVQHSEKINKYLPLIRKATENGDISKTALAMMEDRSLVQQGLEQLYGTQINGKVGKEGKWIYFLWPVKNADSLNMWRKQVGFEQTIEESLKAMNLELKFYKLEEIDNL